MAWDEFLTASRRFFDSPDRIRDEDSRFAAAGRTPAPGWTVRDQGVWIAWQPDGGQLPAQGWKIHVSVAVDEADETISTVLDYCLAHGVAVKFLRSRAIALLLNAKYATRGTSGKLMTLYPCDEASLTRTLSELAQLLGARPGPYILGDLRWGSGPLYLRYGGFLPQHCLSETGQWVSAITDPDGRRVPDVREPVFRVPDWAPVPEVIREQIAAAESEAGDGLPYEVTGVLHFSNGGGLYRAVDPATGQEVVLREARPYAGLDGNGHDAVARLRRERDALRLLDGLDVAPRFLGEFVCWEHHFLVEEFIPGERLRHVVANRHPLIYPNPSRQEIAEYTAWALGVIADVERAVERIHALGLVHADVHLDNIMLRPDGRVTLVDFEQAFALDEEFRPTLASAAFSARWSRGGADMDRYSLACLRLAMFVPLTALFGLDRAKADWLVDLVADRFPVPADFRQRVRDGLGTPTAAAVVPASPRRATDAAALGDAILAHATPDRTDRLFPGDRDGLGPGGAFFAHGAAGILWALAATGTRTAAELDGHTDWLARAARRTAEIPPGLFEGAHGVAYALHALGRPDDARELVDRVRPLAARTPSPGLYHGLAGIGLTLLQVGQETHDPALTSAAHDVGDRLSALVRGADVGLAAPGVGLFHGWSGLAAFLVRLYRVSGDPEHLDAAVTAVRRDLDRCVLDRKGGLQVAEGSRYLLYLGTGSGGIAMAAHDVLAHRPETDLRVARDRVLAALRAELVVEPGLFTGRAGLMVVAGHLADADPPYAAEVLDLHRERLGWYAVDSDGHVAYPGTGLLRLSMDVATGSAGVLLALHASQRPGSEVLPMLGGHRPVRSEPLAIGRR